MAEHKKEEKKAIKIVLPKFNPWILVSLVLALALVLSLVKGWNVSGKSIGALSINDAANKAVDYINNNLVEPGTSVSLVSTEDLGTVYMITVNYQGSDIPTFVTKDAGYLFVSAYNTSESTQTETPKTDKPVVQLYVMSFCPYGMQAEQAMKHVVDLLGSKATIEPHFIVSVSGTTINSLHGEYEANEDIRQACVWKNYGQATFWKYVDYINNNCNSDNIDTCWKDAAKNASVSVTKIETCQTDEGLDLMKAEGALSDSKGVSGSPTLIINGVVYSGSRTPDAYKQAICNAFTTPPAECSQTLSTTGTTASGGCA